MTELLSKKSGYQERKTNLSTQILDVLMMNQVQPTDLQLILSFQSFVQGLGFLRQLFLQEDNRFLGERNVLHIVFAVSPGQFGCGAENTFHCLQSLQVPRSTSRQFGTRTFPLVQLLLHNLNSVSVFQNMISPFRFPQICQELIPLLASLQKLLQN